MLALSTHASVPITQNEQRQARRVRVWELYSQGLSTREIVAALKEKEGVQISQKTISNDLTFLRQQFTKRIKNNNTERVVEEYHKVLSNLEQLIKLAWEHMRSTQSDSVKIGLYSIIEGLNMTLLNVQSINDLIKQEVELSKAGQHAENIKEQLDNLVGKQSADQSIF